MRKRQHLALGVLLGVIAGAWGYASMAYSQPPPPPNPREETLPQRVARLAKLSEADANRFLTVLGPAIREELSRGREIALPGLGAFRVVRVAEHRDLRNGRPVVIPAVNTVEFLPEGGTLEAANSETARPAETVPNFQYILLPNEIPSQRVPKTKVPPFRTP
jgi:nucleoid DNA-binding protein